MSCKTILAGVAIAIAAGMPCGTSWAGDDRPQPPPRLTPEQRQSIHDCMAAKGIAMPPMPREVKAGGPPPDDVPPPDDRAGRPGGAPPPMTDSQRQAMDACFAAAGVAPPRRPEDNGH